MTIILIMMGMFKRMAQKLIKPPRDCITTSTVDAIGRKKLVGRGKGRKLKLSETRLHASWGRPSSDWASLSEDDWKRPRLSLLQNACLHVESDGA